MYEELISRLKNLAMLTTENGKSAILVSNEAVQAIREIATEAADAIEELSKSRWISTEELLPKDLQNVLVIDDGRVTIGHCEHYYCDEQICVEWHDTLYYPIDPPYWQPLPELPKEET